jgi:hypothetical protein
MSLSIDDVRSALLHRRLEDRESAVESAIASINQKKHVVFVSDDDSQEVAIALAELLADGAARTDLCIGWLNLYGATAALIPLNDLVQGRFVNELWVVVTEPSPETIARVVDDVRRLWRNAGARLLMATTHAVLRQAQLSPAARRLLIPVSL